MAEKTLLIEQLQEKLASDINDENDENDEIQPSNIKKIKPQALIKNIDDYDKSQWINLRNGYAEKLFILLCVEILATFVLVILIGMECLVISESTLNITVVAILLHTFGLVEQIVTNLFKK